MDDDILGIRVDFIRIDQAIKVVQGWLSKRGKHYIVTPNPEMIVDAQRDLEFKKALNSASLAIADSPRLGWGKIVEERNILSRLFLFPFFLFPQAIAGKNYESIAGIDLMGELIKLSEKKGFTTAYLGGSKRVANKLRECLMVKYPKLRVVFCSGNISVDEHGKSKFHLNNTNLTGSKDIKYFQGLKRDINAHSLSQKIDILFVAFGHIKQEKWIYQNLPKLNARVMIGVGGAFDYLSGSIPRAPIWMRSTGLEWLFRFLVQPTRIKRFWKLPVFVYKVMTSK